MVVWAAEERVRFARSQAVQSRRTARALRIATEVFLVLALELLGKVGNEMVIEVLATKMGVTRRHQLWLLLRRCLPQWREAKHQMFHRQDRR